MNVRYFIAVVPPENIAGEITAMKQDFADRFNSKAALRSPAHITLHMPFLWKEEKEERLIKALENFRFDAGIANIELCGFDHFDDRVVFVNVEKNESLNRLQAALVQYCKHYLHLFNQADDMRGFHPHITVAFRDLKKKKFEEAWTEYAQKPYTASFPMSSFVLLKHDGKQWNVYHTFEPHV